MEVFCSSLMSCFPGILFRYFPNDFETVPVASLISGTTLVLYYYYYYYCGPGSSVGIAIDYGLDGPGIESRWVRDFPHLSRPALGPPSLLYNGHPIFPGDKVRPGCAADHSPPSSAEVTEE
jgi:hypothetical protein